MSDSARTLLVGVDGGGTGCRAAIGTVRDGILARTEGGRANVATDLGRAVENVLPVVEEAAHKADISSAELKDAIAHVGLAGVMTDADAAKVRAALPFGTARVTDDRPTALMGALGGDDGFLLAAGTGTFIAAMQSGEFRTIGGWGFEVGDQGSGAWLGRRSLEHALLCHDGLEAHTDLTRDLLDRFDGDPNALVAFSLTAKPGDYGAFAPAVVAAARDGDPWGAAIMTEGAGYFARALHAARFQPGDKICLTGGVGPHYIKFMPDNLMTGLVDCRGSGLDGAFHLARQVATSVQETA